LCYKRGMDSLPWWFWVAVPVAVMAGWSLIGRMWQDFSGSSSWEYLEHRGEREEQNRLWEEKARRQKADDGRAEG
jgi:hypothetical protein